MHKFFLDSCLRLTKILFEIVFEGFFLDQLVLHEHFLSGFLLPSVELLSWGFLHLNGEFKIGKDLMLLLLAFLVDLGNSFDLMGLLTLIVL